jgi:hypothetical protein
VYETRIRIVYITVSSHYSDFCRLLICRLIDKLEFKNTTESKFTPAFEKLTVSDRDYLNRYSNALPAKLSQVSKSL